MCNYISVIYEDIVCISVLFIVSGKIFITQESLYACNLLKNWPRQVFSGSVPVFFFGKKAAYTNRWKIWTHPPRLFSAYLNDMSCPNILLLLSKFPDSLQPCMPGELCPPCAFLPSWILSQIEKESIRAPVAFSKSVSSVASSAQA